MQKFKRKYFWIAGVAVFGYLIFHYLPFLDILTGYASKNMASGLFLANRDMSSMQNDDNAFFPVSLASYKVDTVERSVRSSLWGINERKAIYVEGRGAVLLNDTKIFPDNLVPGRKISRGFLPYPYGNLPQRDTVFQELDYDQLEKAVNMAFDPKGIKKKQTRSVLVVYKDQIVTERYANGIDSATIINGWSMAKSVTSTMYGVLQKKGLIQIEDKTGIDEWNDDDRLEITIDDLLHMNSGLAWDESYFSVSDVTKMLYLDGNMGVSQIKKPLDGEPGQSWNYSSGTTNVLAGPLMRNLFEHHQDYLDYWYKELIDRIGMHSMVVETDLSGNYIGSSYSWATTRDWAKLGLLYLHSGNWNGEQVLDSSWVGYVSKPTPTSEGRYGAQFWLNSGGYFPDVPKNMFYCDGFQGQFVFIFPDLDLVVVRTGLASGPDFNVNDFLRDIILSLN